MVAFTRGRPLSCSFSCGGGGSSGGGGGGGGGGYDSDGGRGGRGRRRHREQEELRRQQEGFKPNYMENREQEMRMGDMGPRGAINMGDAFSPAPAGTQGPPPMMGMNMNNRGTIPGPPMGPGPAMGPEGAANMGTPMIPDNGAVHNDRFPQGPPSQMGSPMGNRTGSETPQAPMSGVGPVSGGPGGFGRGSQGGNFEGPNKRRRY